MKSNDMKMLRIISIVMAALAVLCVGGVMVLNFTTRNLCSNKTQQQVASPDGAYKVVVFQRDCGQTSGYSTEVSILRGEATLSNKVSGNIMDMKGAEGTAVQVKWTGERSVLILYPGDTTVFFTKDQYKDGATVIQVSFQAQPVPGATP